MLFTIVTLRHVTCQMSKYLPLHLQYKCNASVISWTDTESNRSQTVCDFSAGEYVSCQVRAFTSAGPGEQSNQGSAKTLCVGKAIVIVVMCCHSMY